MKKNNFKEGAIIATLGIIITKILGLIYVIPFHSIIGEQGGALYGYAYTVYNLFLNISTVGIPIAMSKLISEYNALEYYYSKEEAFRMGRKIIAYVSFLSFVLLVLFAENLAYLIIGNIKGGNSIADVTMVIRVVSTAIIFVPLLSVYRGYSQGHGFITVTSISQIIEQLIRVTLIIIGSFVAIKILNLSLPTAVGIAVFGATLGAVVSYVYVLAKLRKHRKSFNRNAEKSIAEKDITKKVIIKKILMYSLPFVILGFAKSIFNFIDMATVVKTMVNSLSYSVIEAEHVMGVLTTWGYKLNMIVVAISSGILVSLIPNISSSYITGNLKEVSRKANLALQMLLFVTVPLTIGLSFLSIPVWTIFYGNDLFGANMFAVSIFTALFVSLYTTVVSIVQSINHYKMVFVSLVLGVLVKLVFNIPLMTLASEIGYNPYVGVIAATIMGYIISIVSAIVYLQNTVSIKFNETFKVLARVLFGSAVMLLGLLIMRLVISFDDINRFVAIIYCALFGGVGATIYFYVNRKLFVSIFGNGLINKIKKRFNK